MSKRREIRKFLYASFSDMGKNSLESNGERPVNSQRVIVSVTLHNNNLPFFDANTSTLSPRDFFIPSR